MTTADQPDILQAFAQVAPEIAGAGDAVGARGVLVTRARDALGSAGTALWHLTPKAQMALDSYTDRHFMDLMTDIVGHEPDGPAWQAMHDRQTTLADDFETETRWPDYTRRLLAESPVRSAVVYPLGLGDHDLGVLAVDSHQRHYFQPAVVAFGAVFAACASLALDNASLTEKTRTLEEALRSNRRIGIGIGVLMARNHLTEMQAFDLLRVTSQGDLAEHQHQAGRGGRGRHRDRNDPQHRDAVTARGGSA